MSQLLVRWSAGDQRALEALIPIVYGELRLLGRSALRRQGRESILQPTALVHEAWLRMVGNHRLSLESRRQFYALAAKMMRDILVDHLRRKQAAKRGGSQIEVALDDANPALQPHCVDFLILMPFIPLYFDNCVYLERPEIHGLRLNLLGIPCFKYAWIDDTRRVQ